MSGFGRKGLTVKQSIQPKGKPAADLELAAKREAFLVQERASRSADQDSQIAQNLSETFQYQQNKPARSMGMAYLYWLILGQISMHRFYIGAKESAIYQVSLFFGGLAVTFIYPPLGLCILAVWAIWLLADVFLIPGLIRKHVG